MLAALDPAATPPVVSSSWGDLAGKALADILRGLTGGQAAADLAGKVAPYLNPGGAEAAAAAEAKRQADADRQRTMVLALVGLGGAVVIGALLLTRGR